MLYKFVSSYQQGFPEIQDKITQRAGSESFPPGIHGVPLRVGLLQGTLRSRATHRRLRRRLPHPSRKNSIQ
ncbi:hypothetical protein COR50_13345 [Chitinophaga caeni]|uniref:Uncharacterized protein n=1 Tax=Chitinophaga caeni TaxID=2029983 RepID=A0A291QVW0_9BACT|nr:hypothetical protein COR50_13345 [Chitinophaga caeni]